MSQIKTDWIIDAIKKSLSECSKEPLNSGYFEPGKPFRVYLSVSRNLPHGSTPQYKKQVRSDFDKIKKEFQDTLALERNLGGKTEHQLFDDTKDRADVWVDKGKYEVIIEIDAARADQVGKKMLSRYCYSARISPKPVVYVALLYQGTTSMNQGECEKYFQMGYEVLKKINDDNIFIGYIISNNPKDIPYLPNDYKAVDKQLYMAYLSGKTPQSVNSYMLPLNRVHLFVSPKEIQKKLCQYDGKSDINKLLRNLKILKKKEELTSNQKTYWKTYCEHLNQNATKLGL
mgnify:CR=1 FL=1